MGGLIEGELVGVEVAEPLDGEEAEGDVPVEAQAQGGSPRPGGGGRVEEAAEVEDEIVAPPPQPPQGEEPGEGAAQPLASPQEEAAWEALDHLDAGQEASQGRHPRLDEQVHLGHGEAAADGADGRGGHQEIAQGVELDDEDAAHALHHLGGGEGVALRGAAEEADDPVDKVGKRPEGPANEDPESHRGPPR